MDQSWKNCWDCPVPLFVIVVQFVVLALVVLVAVRLQRRESEALTAVGWLMAMLAFLWAAALTRAVPRWDILKSAHHVAVYSENVATIIMYALDAVLGGIFIAARSERRPRIAPSNQHEP